ncbi:hypothetical protein RQM47_08445 [Rubrivirga sp. S365]|uniref:hypothetical protein n=1 Tax=Rubrivirga sp. S365 TaxID=3076080 RepID=UPI0028CAFCCC|nr:hypothetical protein [Rubrivirga sp. S365]MDT7856666.1 hypothetical protein [Rubrivirga sp. S365]
MSTDHVRILGIYEDALATSHAGDHITTLVLRLSGDPSDDWISAFNLEWSRTDYLRKRSVHVGSVRVHNETEVRQGLVVHTSPEDYVSIHKPHVERAVERANAQAAWRDRQQDATVARANRTIRAINADYYAAGRGGDERPGERAAVEDRAAAPPERRETEATDRAAT